MYRQALQPYSFTDTVCMVVKKLEMFSSFNSCTAMMMMLVTSLSILNGFSESTQIHVRAIFSSFQLFYSAVAIYIISMYILSTWKVHWKIPSLLILLPLNRFWWIVKCIYILADTGLQQSMLVVHIWTKHPTSPAPTKVDTDIIFWWPNRMVLEIIRNGYK